MHFVLSKLDYCNSLLVDRLKSALKSLQLIRNAAVIVLMRIRRRDHHFSLLISLQWIPGKSRRDFKILLFTYKAIMGQAPHPKELIVPVIRIDHFSFRPNCHAELTGAGGRNNLEVSGS